MPKRSFVFTIVLLVLFSIGFGLLYPDFRLEFIFTGGSAFYIILFPVLFGAYLIGWLFGSLYTKYIKRGEKDKYSN